jgi:5-oxoprolinase (ATP-hydrolysing) subunit A
MLLDLNCDLGEGEPLGLTEALLRCVTSANIACGGHAGDESSMRACIQIAIKNDVAIGAHPGLAGNFGRSSSDLNASAFEELLQNQVGTFCRILQEHGGKLHHFKLHGALYHLTEVSPTLRSCYLNFVESGEYDCAIFCLAGGTVAAEGRSRGVEIWEEAFLDRNYLANGSLVPRNEAKALLTEPSEVARRLEQLLKDSTIEVVDGSLLQLNARTLCIHSDSPNSLEIAALARRILESQKAD